MTPCLLLTGRSTKGLTAFYFISFSVTGLSAALSAFIPFNAVTSWMKMSEERSIIFKLT